MTKETQLAIPEAKDALAVHTPARNTGDLLERFIASGVTGENVAAFGELVRLKRDEDQHQNKIAFNKAFFALKKDVASLELYCDKEANSRDGTTMYRYCSESEISEKLEPLLMRHGFAMMFGQSAANERLVAEITLIHEEGHEEKRSYAVRQGATNAAKDATQADTGATTSAWRHLVTKMFGLKSRISEQGDAKNEGEKISADKAQYLKEQVKGVGFNEKSFFALAGCDSYEEITTGKYSVLINALTMKARQAK